MRYSLTDFNKILATITVTDLPDTTVNIINTLAAQVGAPEYVKTPQFKNKSGNGILTNTSGIRRKKKYQDINDDDWETIRSFHTTEFQKKEGIEINLHSIRKYLNMITINTYEKLKDSIIKEINTINLEKTQNDLLYLCNQIFDIVSNNILYSDIYAKLYKDLISEFSIFSDILICHFKQLEHKFINIEYSDPEQDYNKFCENNKKNELLRSNCTFYVNLMRENIIEKEAIIQIIINLFTTLDNMISSKSKKNELDELSELLYIMIINSYDFIKKEYPDLTKEIYNNVVRITKIKIKDEPGITNKCIFKHMDILDEISDTT